MKKALKGVWSVIQPFLPYVLLIGVAYVAFKALFPGGLSGLFSGMLSTPATTAADAATQKGLSNATVSTAVAATGLAQLQQQLAAQGYTIDSDSAGNANTLYNLLNSYFPDQDAICNDNILTWTIGDFQLCAINYGQQGLPKYADNPLNLGSFIKAFVNEFPVYGDLKFHLTTVLDDTHQQSISAYLDSIP